MRKLIPHTADVRLQVEAQTLEELFAEALLGMAQLLKKKFSEAEIKDQKSKVKKNIRIQSPDLTALLIDFLSEALTQSQMEKAVFYRVNFRELANTMLDADIVGMRVDAFAEDIKAVTYHEAEVRKNEKGNYETILVFDI